MYLLFTVKKVKAVFFFFVCFLKRIHVEWLFAAMLVTPATLACAPLITIITPAGKPSVSNHARVLSLLPTGTPP